MKQLTIILTTLAALSLVAAATAMAQAAPDPATAPADAAAWTYQAFASGEYWAAAGMVLLALVALLRRFAGKLPYVGAWLTTTDDGGTIFTLIVSFGAVLGAGLIADGEISWGLAETALLYGGSATAAWSVAWKRLLKPLLARIFD